MTNKSQAPSPLRVFVSSTYEDMITYREAVREALTNIEQLPVGMEQFVSSSDKSLDVCLSEVRRCQLFISIIGMRYGNVDDETGKSYSELEYEESVRNNIPVLAFVINENECPVLPKFVDTGIKADKLQKFKKHLDENHMVSRFSSDLDLKQLAIRAINSFLSEKAEEKEQKNVDQYLSGNKTFKNFLLLPEIYKNTEATLRVRMDGGFSSWRRREAYTEAYGLPPGKTIIGNDMIPIDIDLSDMEDDDCSLDFYAEGKAAEWVLENGIKPGSIFEGKFLLVYEPVEGSVGKGTQIQAIKIAALILVEPIKLVGQARPKKKSESDDSKTDGSAKSLYS